MRFSKLLVFAVLFLGATVVAADSATPRGNGEPVKITATPSVQEFVSTSPFHLSKTLPFEGEWEGCVLRVHVLDGTEISVLGGRISNQGQGTSGAGVLDELPPPSEQNATSTFLATAFNTGIGGLPDLSHNCPATVTVHANHNGENSDTDLDIQVYDIMRISNAVGCSCSDTFVYPSDLVFVPAGFAGGQVPSALADPATGHFIHWSAAPAHLACANQACPNQTNPSLIARRTGRQPIGMDHEAAVPAHTESTLLLLAVVLLTGGTVILVRARRRAS